MYKITMNLGIIIPICLSIFREGQSMNHNPQPKNTIALLNREVILRCHKDENVDIPVSWKFYDFGKTQNHGGLLISNRGRVHSPFNDTFLLNRTSPGQFDLVIPRVVAGNAGIYECTKSGNNTPTAHLTILDADPVCVVRVANRGTGLVLKVLNGDTIHLSCAMHLTGHCQPTVDWTIDNGTFIGRFTSNDTNSRNRTSISMFDFVVNSKKGNVSFIATVSFTCPKRSFHFNNLSTANPEYEHIWKSSEIEILDSFATSTAVTTPGSDGGALVLRDKLGVSFLAVIACGVLLMIMAKFLKGIRCWQLCKGQQSGIDIYDDIPRSKEIERRDDMDLRLYFGTANLSQSSDYIEIEMPDSIRSEESVAVVNPGRGTKARPSEIDPNYDRTGIRLLEVSQDGEIFEAVVSTVPLSSKKNKSRSQTATLPNRQTNKNYIELDPTKMDRPVPSVYKRLSNKKQRLVQSSQVPHTQEFGDEQHYCNVSRPRLPTPESNTTSDESNMDQLAA